MQIILDESSKILSTDKNVILVEHKLGFININAGLDRSNIDQKENNVSTSSKIPQRVQINFKKYSQRYSNNLFQ